VFVAHLAGIDVLLADRREVLQLVGGAVTAGEVLERLHDDVGLRVDDDRPVVEVRVLRFGQIATVLAKIEVDTAAVGAVVPAVISPSFPSLPPPRHPAAPTTPIDIVPASRDRRVRSMTPAGVGAHLMAPRLAANSRPNVLPPPRNPVV